MVALESKSLLTPTLEGEETIPMCGPESSSEAKDLFTSTRGKDYLSITAALTDSQHD